MASPWPPPDPTSACTPAPPVPSAWGVGLRVLAWTVVLSPVVGVLWFWILGLLAVTSTGFSAAAPIGLLLLALVIGPWGGLVHGVPAAVLGGLLTGLLHRRGPPGWVGLLVGLGTAVGAAVVVLPALGMAPNGVGAVLILPVVALVVGVVARNVVAGARRRAVRAVAHWAPMQGRTR